jgi:hypothetical protein
MESRGVDTLEYRDRRRRSRMLIPQTPPFLADAVHIGGTRAAHHHCRHISLRYPSQKRSKPGRRRAERLVTARGPRGRAPYASALPKSTSIRLQAFSAWSWL